MTALAIPGYMVGHNVTVSGAAGLVVASDGTFSQASGATYDFVALGIADEVEFRSSWDQEEIQPIGAYVKNHVNLMTDFEITINEIVGVGGLSLLYGLFYNYSYVRVGWSVTRPGASSPTANFAAIGIIRDASNGGLKVGKTQGSLSCNACGIAPYYGTGTPPF